MCKLCKSLICPMNCPNWSGEEKASTKRYCVLCGARFSAEERFYEMNGFPYCEPCLLAADGETLVRICEKNEREWLEGMGFFSQISKEATEC